MSGGHYEYAYSKVDQFIDKLLATPTDEYNLPLDQVILRKKFAKHLLLVSKAMRAIEWVDSGDSSWPEDGKAISKCLKGKI